MGVQVNGKVRGTIEVNQETTQDEALTLANEHPNIKHFLEGKETVKVIYKATRILNIIVKG
jgi:leucyl-tRNA synthetase